MKTDCYLGLVHHPILNKRGDIVTTSVTNLDIHDISRSSRTFGFKKYFIITPLEAQHETIKRILGHWEEDKSNEYNPDRVDALSTTYLVNSIAEAKQQILEEKGLEPLVVVTSAYPDQANGNEVDLTQRLVVDKRPMLLLFGTGWGLAPEVMEMADFCLMPIVGSKYPSEREEYRHLSVRSAVAIYCDRILRAFEAKENN